MKATAIHENPVNGHDNKTSETEAFESMKYCSLAPQWLSHLWPSKVAATGFAHTMGIVHRKLILVPSLQISASIPG